MKSDGDILWKRQGRTSWARRRCGDSRRYEDSAAKEGRRASWKSERILRGEHSVRIGVPKEIKDQEGRVGITPAGVQELVSAGHVVLVQKEAGEQSGISDREYERRGARITQSAADAWDAEMVMKVKEPLPEEYPQLRPRQILFTYVHLAAALELTQTLLEAGTVTIAYETVQLPDGELPLLIPMSEVAGRMSIQEGAFHLKRTAGGKGTLLGGVTGVAPANVVILGGGVVGAHAAKIATGMGAQVTVLERSSRRMA